MPKKRKYKTDIAQYSAVPSREEYKGTDFGYGAKRYFGGPLWRTIEFPQQYLYAMIAGPNGRLPDDWNAGSPFSRILYPSRYPRITAAAVTGVDNPWVNLAVEVGLDPVNLIGGVGAATKLGKASKAVSGLAKAREVKGLTALRGMDAIIETQDLLKAAGRSGGAKEIEKVIKGIIDTEGKWDAYKPLAEGWDEFGETVFEEATRLSEAIRTGKATVFGAGKTTGYGGVADVDLGRGLREPIANISERIEDVIGGFKYGTGTAITAEAGGAAVTNQPKLKWLVNGLRNSAKWDASSYLTKMGVDVRNQWLDDFYSQFATPKEANRALADLITGKQPAGATSRKALTSYQNLMSDVILADERTARDVTSLGLDYIPRILKENDYGERVSYGLYDHLLNKANMSIKGLAGVKRLRRAAGGEPFISVTNLSHYARATESSKHVKSMIQDLNVAADAAKKAGKFNQAKEIINARENLVKLADLWDEGIINRTMSPHEVNSKIRGAFGAEIDEFMKSKAGKRFGFNANSTVDDFEFFEENFNRIIPERLKRYTETTTNQNILGRFIKTFGFSEKTDPIAYDAARKLAGYTKDVEGQWHRYGQDIASSGATEDLVRVTDYLSDRLGRTSESVRNIIGKLAGGDINDLYMSQNSAEAFGDLLKAWEKLPQDAKWLKTWDTVNRYWARMTLFGGRASYLFNNLTGDRWNMYLAGARGRHLMGISGLQAMLPDGKTMKGLEGVKGLADSDVIVVSKSGISYTKRQVLDMLSQFDIDGGLFDSALFETIQKGLFPKKGVVGEVGRQLKQGELTAPMRAVAQMIEKNGRYSLFMHFLEEGYHPAQAAEQVAKYLFDYSKQNQGVRRVMPFYYWTYKNVPLQFKNFFLQPGKQRLPSKVQYAFDNINEDPTNDARPEYLQATGVYLAEHNGKHIYFDLNNLPGYAAQEALGLLSTQEGITGAITEAAKRATIMSSPLIQMVAEFGTGRDLFTGRPFIGGGAGAAVEKGTEEFLGFNIRGIPEAQAASQAVRTIVTPLDIADQLITQYKKPEKRMGDPYGKVKFVLGAPLRQVSPNSAEWVNLSQERNKYINLMEHYESIGDRSTARKYQQKADKLEQRLSKLSESIKRERERDERARRSKNRR